MKDTPRFRIILGIVMILANGPLGYWGVLDQNAWMGQIIGAILAFGGLFLLISGIVMAVKKKKKLRK